MGHTPHIFDRSVAAVLFTAVYAGHNTHVFGKSLAFRNACTKARSVTDAGDAQCRAPCRIMPVPREFSACGQSFIPHDR